MRRFVALLICLLAMNCGMAFAEKTLQRYELEFDERIDRSQMSDVTSLSPYKAGYMELNEETLISTFIGDSAQFESYDAVCARYINSVAPSQLLLAHDGGYGLGLRDTPLRNGFDYLYDVHEEECRLDIDYYENHTTEMNDELNELCSAAQLEFMSRQDAAESVKELLADVGIENIEVEYQFGITKEMISANDVDNEGNGGECRDYYEMGFRQTIDGIPINSRQYVNKVGIDRYWSEGSRVYAILDERGVTTLRCVGMLVPERAGEPMPIISCEQACKTIEDYYSNKFMTYPHVVADVELIYHDIFTDEPEQFELTPAWAFTIKQVSPYGDGDSYYEYCMINAYTGEMYVAA